MNMSSEQFQIPKGKPTYEELTVTNTLLRRQLILFKQQNEENIDQAQREFTILLEQVSVYCVFLCVLSYGIL